MIIDQSKFDPRARFERVTIDLDFNPDESVAKATAMLDDVAFATLEFDFNDPLALPQMTIVDVTVYNAAQNADCFVNALAFLARFQSLVALECFQLCE